MGEEVGKALVELVDSMRLESLRRSEYRGLDWAKDGKKETEFVLEKREKFESVLRSYVSFLARV